MKNAKNKILICLSGKASCGKSMLIDLLNKDGYQTIKLDNLIHEYYEKGKSGYQFVLDNFGSDYIDNEKVNRKKLGDLVFNNPNKLKLLNDFAEKIVKYHLKNIDNQGIIIVEGAAIYNNQERYLDIFDYFVLIQRDQNLIEDSIRAKFAYLKDFNLKKWNPIKENENFKFDICIQNNSDIMNAYNELKNFLKKINS
ncbi:dephospho-CoA kinase [Mycoplasma bradburyae]|uniref:dephospho-CoA kinase n=1 Tax=Mycoplasma bradburyae TaxID=2963128 RepID=UPI00234012F0|nr:dephospho-CoA kinase [Mycoplasma bradburyae]MDC4182613.1 dephospho-CoA kinase [Mycoplasma bradburyae]MDC4184092.1 dephospho-CoA kinase [Mycoplasma bradburyae]